MFPRSIKQQNKVTCCDLVGLDLFHFNFWGAFLPWVMRILSVDYTDVIYTQTFIAPLSFMSPSPLDEAFLGQPQKDSQLSPGPKQML